MNYNHKQIYLKKYGKIITYLHKVIYYEGKRSRLPAYSFSFLYLRILRISALWLYLPSTTPLD